MSELEDTEITDTILINKYFGWCRDCPLTSQILGWAEDHYATTGHTTMEQESAMRRFGALP